MKNKYSFQVIYFSQYVIMAILMTQIVPFLTFQGYNAVQRGWFLASYSITTIVFQIAVGFYSDKRNDSKNISLFLSIFLTIAIICFYWLGMSMWLVHLIVMAIAGGLANTAAATLDNWVLSDKKSVLYFSTIKSTGSLGWCLASLMIPLIVANGNYQMLSVPLLFFFSLNAAFVRKIPQNYDDHKTKDIAVPHLSLNIKDVYKLCINKPFILCNIIFFMIYLTIVANNTLVIDKLLTFENGNEMVGFKWSIQSFCEIPAYLLLNRTVSKWRNERLIVIAGFFLILQFLIYGLSNNVWIFLCASLFQFFTVPAFTVGSRMLISEITPREVFSSGQLISVSFYIGISSFVAPIISGTLSQYVSINVAIFTFGIFPLVAFLVYIIFKKEIFHKG
ncbi:hypothetical protein A5886_002596 [Enterococcus sp. 8G7_MSG3316]|uniref:Major facilitator superfamily associated domain-containing protein n=1 Tax=Candidatus Enterococcus testudinis TaxID=1834191 RepID=A0A242A8Y1_9ENTE|nr:MFS transporter [Enterococcus sp. 8G7_MSG3316]OTN77496.1 hypothetical protein A5886_002596 [Enterococcus sp. 8G7_MSG3316]